MPTPPRTAWQPPGPLSPGYRPPAAGAARPPYRPSLPASAPPPSYQPPSYQPSYQPPPQPKPPRSFPTGLAVVVAGVLALLLGAGVVVYVLAHGSTRHGAAPKPSPSPTFPAQWDARVLPLISFVQSTRGLTYKTPVYVNFLTPADYTKAVNGSAGGGGPSQSDLATQVGEYRAVGLVSGNPDLNQAGNSLQDAGTLAFYSNDSKQVYVRGTEMTVSLKVTLVHELTHALQDQYFDLSRGDKLDSSGASFAFTSLVEGDAVRVEDAYVASLPAADQAAYSKESDAQDSSSQSALGDVPPALVTLFGAPYDLGPELLKALLAKSGNGAVDDAFRNPPADQLQVFDPWVYLNATQPHPVATPAVPGGAKKMDEGDFGALSWFVVLTQRIDPHVALPAADAWAGDAYVAYAKKGGQICLDATIASSSPAGTAAMMTAFGAWSRAMPAGAASVRQSGSGVAVSACDAGPGAALSPVGTAQDALALPVARTEFTLQSVAQGAPLAFSRCASNLMAQTYSESDLLSGAPFETASGKTKLERLIQPCRSTLG